MHHSLKINPRTSSSEVAYRVPPSAIDSYRFNPILSFVNVGFNIKLIACIDPHTTHY